MKLGRKDEKFVFSQGSDHADEGEGCELAAEAAKPKPSSDA